MVSIVAFQAIDPGSIPGQRIIFILFFAFLLRQRHSMKDTQLQPIANRRK